MRNETSYSTLLASPFKLREAPAEGLEPSLVSLTGSRLTVGPHRILQAPSGSRTHTSAMARQQATATSWAQKCITTKLSKIKNQEHRAGIEPASPRYDGGVLPLDHQCLYFSGIGENRTHIARIKSPMHYLVCHNPMCRRCFVSVGVAGIEPATVAL